MRETAAFPTAEYTYLEKARLYDVKDSQSELIARNSCKKFHSKEAKQFRIVSLQKHIIDIDEDGISIALSIYNVTNLS